MEGGEVEGEDQGCTAVGEQANEAEEDDEFGIDRRSIESVNAEFGYSSMKPSYSRHDDCTRDCPHDQRI